MEVKDLADWPVFPFCSQRCKTIDLGRWLTAAYRIPAEEAPEESGDGGVPRTDAP
jgi:endogenous inhibitor of DNA gyrase (YacG/DUF329 family)